jgi:hypothetical protein
MPNPNPIPPRKVSPPTVGDGARGRGSPREQAFALYCRGLRSPAIAARLGLPERTIRRWLRAIRADVASLRHADRAAELTRAIERHRAVVAAAWDAYDRERQIEDALLAGHYDRPRRRAYYPSTDPDSVSPSRFRGRGQGERSSLLYEDFERPHRLNHGPRYLAIIVAAQREIARLQGLYDLLAEQPPANIQITITRRPDGPENLPPEARLHPIAPALPFTDDNTDDVDTDEEEEEQ